jgi:hypothetical protein
LRERGVFFSFSKVEKKRGERDERGKKERKNGSGTGTVYKCFLFFVWGIFFFHMM